MKRRASRSRSGFTLIEVILAITIFSLIALILYSATYLSRRAAAKAALAAEAGQRERMLGSFVGGYFRSAFSYRSSPQDQAIFFYGEQTRVTFISALSRGLGGRGLAKVTLEWDGEKGDPLTLEEEIPVRFSKDDEISGYRNRTVLYPAVDEFEIRYLPPDGAAADWVDSWDGAETKSLPRAVRLRLSAPGGVKREWVVPIMVKALVR
ncbi:MAG TPA: prepilin-type N-terminal cleavage/methylation domain-containing protein [Candidatus Acidoferrales bacterium]|nr:prepilin-type N-terminal cleavage/methylation domain-containing protein [Candidatus Acidoferrales bacterium]